MKIHFKKRLIRVHAKKTGNFKKFIGLMFKSRNTDVLLFEFSKNEPCTIHSFFVFFPFLAVWLDKDNKVMELNVVKPFTPAVTPKKQPQKLMEIPINQDNRKLIEFFVGKKETFKYIDE